MSYKTVSPEDFTEEQKQYLKSRTDSLMANFYGEEIICAVKDIHSRYVLASDYYARLVGFSRGDDIEGLFDSGLPCKVAEFAQDFVDEEKELLSDTEGSSTKTTLNIHEYVTGLESFISYKSPIIHHDSQSILGTKAVAYKIDLSYMLNLIPNDLMGAGIVGNFESDQETVEINDIPLTEREHEIGFLIVMKWELEHIAHFMNKHRPLFTPITSDVIHGCQEDLCRKFKCKTTNLREKLMKIADLHRKIPASFLKPLVGSRPC